MYTLEYKYVNCTVVHRTLVHKSNPPCLSYGNVHSALLSPRSVQQESRQVQHKHTRLDVRREERFTENKICTLFQNSAVQLLPLISNF